MLVGKLSGGVDGELDGFRVIIGIALQRLQLLDLENFVEQELQIAHVHIAIGHNRSFC